MQEGLDFYCNASGLMVLTEAFLLKRGKCCKSDCKHCPYDFRKKNKETHSINDGGDHVHINQEFYEKE